MPNPTDVHDPRAGAWVAVLSSSITTAILQDGFDELSGTLLAADATEGLSAAELRALAGLDDAQARSFVDLVTFAPHPLAELTVNGDRACLERTRVPNGSCLWRVDAAGERRVLTYYDGPAYGWRNGRGYAEPVEPLGPWATFDGHEYAAAFPAGESDLVGLVAVGAEPPEGFTWTRPGVSMRYVALTELDDLTAR